MLNHKFVPKQSKLTEKEKKEVLEKHNVNVKHLPKILIKDPSIAHLEPNVGDVIKIERESPTSGKTVYYRGVANE